MASLALLEYPNGRCHATVLDWTLAEEAEFELYGRRRHALGLAVDWQIGNQVTDRHTPRPIRCRSLGKTARSEWPCVGLGIWTGVIVLRPPDAPAFLLEDSQAQALVDALWLSEVGKGRITLAAAITYEMRRTDLDRRGIDLDPAQAMLVSEALRSLSA
jgi:hypothetical protein